MRQAIFFLILIACAALFVSPARGQSSDLHIFLVTMGPGDAAWEKFGHDAIWIHDPVAGTDKAYNWGVFDFGGDFFIRFIQGRMRYWVEPWDAYEMMAMYKQDNRSILLQELNLTSEQKREMQRFMEWNARPENKYYTYDYYRDNCTTRIRDVIDRATSGTVRKTLEPIATGTTFRWHTRRLTSETPWLYVCLNYVLGKPVDQPISAWQESFLPGKLAEHLRKVTTANGALVLDEHVVFTANRPPEPSAPPVAWPYFLGAGIGIGMLLIILGTAGQHRRIVRWGFALVACLWALLAGVAGGICTWGWLFTDHWAAKYNENWLQLNILALGLVILIPMAARKTGRRAAGRRAFVLAGVLAGLSIFGLAMKISPVFRQVNGEIIALALPAQLGLFVGVAKINGLSLRGHYEKDELAGDGAGDKHGGVRGK